MNYSDFFIPAQREDHFDFRGLSLYMPRMAKAKTMLVGKKESVAAICTSWDDPELVLTDELIGRVAIAAPIRSTYGVNILLANLALNPHIRYLIFLRGGEFDETETGSLPRKVINFIWKNGVDEKGKVVGTEFSLLPELLENGGLDILRQITKDVEIIDWQGKDKESLDKLSKRIDNLLPKVTSRKPFAFSDFKVEEVVTLPSERYAHDIREKTPALAWLRLVDRILRYGKTTLLEEKEQTKIRELPFERITIEKLEEEGFKVPEWLANIPEVRITPDELEAYYQKFIKPDTYYHEIYPGITKFIRPTTDKYLYCELLFAFPRPKEIDRSAAYVYKNYGGKAVFAYLAENYPVDETKLQKAKEVAQDKGLDDEKKLEILLEIFRPPKNQIAEMQKRLKEIGSDADKTLILWDPNVHSFLYSGRPCWVESAALLRDGTLNFKAVFRSHDIAKGWLKNVYGIYRLCQEYFCQPIGAKLGTISIESESGHIYVADLSWVKKLWDEQVGKNNLLGVDYNKPSDPRGNVAITVEGKEVEVTLLSPEDGRPLESYKGTADSVFRQVVDKGLLSVGDHWAYFGKEIRRAEECIEKGIPYTQDKV